MQAANYFAGQIGQTVGHTTWFTMTQDRITAFGGVTLDFDPHHIDPRQAQHGPFGKPAAQGFLTLSLLTHFIEQMPRHPAITQHVNYGLNKVRFIRPVLVGETIRAAFVLQDAKVRPDNGVMLTWDVTLESEGHEKPAMTAQWLVLVYE